MPGTPSNQPQLWQGGRARTAWLRCSARWRRPTGCARSRASPPAARTRGRGCRAAAAAPCGGRPARPARPPHSPPPRRRLATGRAQCVSLLRNSVSQNFESLQRECGLRCQSAASTTRRWPSAHHATAACSFQFTSQSRCRLSQLLHVLWPCSTIHTPPVYPGLRCPFATQATGCCLQTSSFSPLGVHAKQRGMHTTHEVFFSSTRLMLRQPAWPHPPHGRSGACQLWATARCQVVPRSQIRGRTAPERARPPGRLDVGAAVGAAAQAGAGARRRVHALLGRRGRSAASGRRRPPRAPRQGARPVDCPDPLRRGLLRAPPQLAHAARKLRCESGRARG